MAQNSNERATNDRIVWTAASGAGAAPACGNDQSGAASGIARTDSTPSIAAID